MGKLYLTSGNFMLNSNMDIIHILAPKYYEETDLCFQYSIYNFDLDRKKCDVLIGSM